jgi:hypothetical protein
LVFSELLSGAVFDQNLECTQILLGVMAHCEETVQNPLEITDLHANLRKMAERSWCPELVELLESPMACNEHQHPIGKICVTLANALSMNELVVYYDKDQLSLIEIPYALYHVGWLATAIKFQELGVEFESLPEVQELRLFSAKEHVELLQTITLRLLACSPSDALAVLSGTRHLSLEADPEGDPLNPAA